MAEPALVRSRRDGAIHAEYSPDWIGRFAESYRLQDQTWVKACVIGRSCEDLATARDGLMATSYCEQLVRTLPMGSGPLVQVS